MMHYNLYEIAISCWNHWQEGGEHEAANGRFNDYIYTMSPNSNVSTMATINDFAAKNLPLLVTYELPSRDEATAGYSDQIR